MATTESAYQQQSKRFAADFRTSYRFNAEYLASKAMTDWRLLHGSDFFGRRVLNVGASEPIDEERYAEYAELWVSLDLNEQARPGICSNAAAMPFSDGTFDVVCAFSSLEHIEDVDVRRRAFEECYRVLVIGGKFLVTVPSRWNPAWRLASEKLMREGRADFGYGYNYSPVELKRLLEGIGFEVGWRNFVGDLMPAYAVVPYDWPARWILQLFSARMGFEAVKK